MEGGAITGAPKQIIFSPPPPPTSSPVVPVISPDPPQHDSEWYVQTIFDCLGEEEKELSFKRGETLLVKEKIDQNWLLCTRGDESGIVPTNYVKNV